VDNSGSGKLPDNTPPNDSPQSLMVRFETTYEYQVLAEYKLLLTQDFRFTFSNQTDPTLVTKYGNNWGKVDEETSAGNLFDGFTDDQAVHHNGASSIELTLTALNYGEDPLHLGDTEHYQKVSVTSVTGTIEIPSDNGGEPSKFLLDARQEFYIVRGDVAVLDTDQAADVTHWYIYRWDDLSAPLAGARGLARINPASEQCRHHADKAIHIRSTRPPPIPQPEAPVNPVSGGICAATYRPSLRSCAPVSCRLQWRG
jgi:hypothetical protein